MIQPLNTQNPGNAPARTKAERQRVPMSVPVQKLSVPDMPGWHLHWFLNSPSRIQRAQQGGYEFVDSSEISLNNADLGGESTQSGNTDMGSQVSVVAGKQLADNGQPERLILMKIRQEWYEEDQKLLDQTSARTVAALSGGMVGAEKEAGSDAANRYLDKKRQELPKMFQAKPAQRNH